MTDAIAPTLAPAHLAAVVESTRQTLGMLFGGPPTFAPLRAQTPDGATASEVCVLVGFTGDLGGQIMLGMSRHAALEMAGTLMMAPLTDFDAITHSAIGEVSNMIAGACATALANCGLVTNITIPTLIMGDHLHVQWPSLPIQETEGDLPFGALSLTIGLKLAATP